MTKRDGAWKDEMKATETGEMITIQSLSVPSSPRDSTVQLALLMNGLRVDRPTLFCLV